MLIYPIFIPQLGCPNHCIFCDQVQFDSVKLEAFDVISLKLKQFCHKHKNKSKQIAFYGGNFTGLELSDRETYFNLVQPFIDDNLSIRISTRPDYINTQTLAWCKEHHIKTIELGIQDFSTVVLEAARRGYDFTQATDACYAVKNSGFELGVQLMPGLPQSTPLTISLNHKTLKEVLPDFIRLYPLIVLHHTPIWKEYESGNFIPLSLEQAIDVCVDYFYLADEIGIKVTKIGIPALDKNSRFIGPYHPAFGELVKGEILIRKIVTGYKPEDVVHISRQDISLLTGHQGYNLIKLLKRLDLCTIKIEPLSELKSFEVSYSGK